MANLNIENLGKIVQTGDVERLFTGGVHLEKSSASESGSAGGALGETGKTFSDILKDSVDKVNLDQTQADTAIKELVAGRNKNIHETMLTIERADTSLKLMMQVRNKILDAYKEIMRMQV